MIREKWDALIASYLVWLSSPVGDACDGKAFEAVWNELAALEKLQRDAGVKPYRERVREAH